jgi:hypothetical protein
MPAHLVGMARQFSVGSIEQHREQKDQSANHGNPAISPLSKDHGCCEAGRKS